MKQSKIKSLFNATKIASIVDTIEEEIFYLSRVIIIEPLLISDLCELSKEQALKFKSLWRKPPKKNMHTIACR